VVDLHTHILPGFDDGARDLGEALAMACLAAEDGITCLLATPHWATGEYAPGKGEVLSAVDAINARLAEEEIPVKVLPGAEYRLEPDLPERFQKGGLLTLGGTGRYLLVEFPAALIPPFAERVLYALQLLGLVPVVAHPERSPALAGNPGFLRALVGRGVLTQVTAASITGEFGKEVRRLALTFLKEGLAHFVASDAHSPEGRAPVLSPALREVERRMGKGTVEYLLENARRVVDGRGVTERPTDRKAIKGKSFFSLAFGRISSQKKKNSF
jgi:protein-tyrosine phosphatase